MEAENPPYGPGAYRVAGADGSPGRAAHEGSPPGATGCEDRLGADTALRRQSTVEMPCLVPCFTAFLVDMRTEKVRPLSDGDSLLVGRSEGCALVMDDPSVSRIHARIWSEGGTCLVEDLGSTNGTFVNGERLRPLECAGCAHGSIVRFGGSFLRVEVGNRRHCVESGVAMHCMEGGFLERAPAKDGEDRSARDRWQEEGEWEPCPPRERDEAGERREG